jgi:hypothetical protein
MELSPGERAALRQWYGEHVAPRIVALPPATIRHATGLSERYVALIRRGHVPHSLHFVALARVVGRAPPI